MEREPVKGSAKLTLAITVNRQKGPHHEEYAVVKLSPHPSIGAPAFQLTKPDGECYDVILRRTGAECTCPDWLWCRDHKDAAGCKHVRALRAVGLLVKE